jgi:hypothetical protein
LICNGPVEKAWLDAASLKPGRKQTLDLAAGLHSITLTLRAETSGQVRLELTDVTGSNAQAIFVGGK